MKVLVCGGRTFGIEVSEYQFIMNTLNKLSIEWPRSKEDSYGNWLPEVTIISGGAKGVDSAAIDWAVVNWTRLEVYRANWKTHGKAAGPIRNQKMLDEGKPDLVVAFPGGRGTADMVERAEKADIRVIKIAY